MLSSALAWWLLSVGALVGYGTLVGLERRRGARFGVGKLRTYGDYALLWCGRTWQRFVRSFLQLRWHYWVHCTYRFVLLSLQRLYHRLESRFEANRQRAKRLRREVRAADTEAGATHLHAVAEHKAATALSATEKRRLKKKSLEQKW